MSQAQTGLDSGPEKGILHYMKNAIAPGDMVAAKIDGLYVTCRVTRLLPAGYLVKTVNGRLHDVNSVLPMRNDAESQAVIAHMLSGN